MSNLLKILIISIVAGVLISAGSYLVTKTEPLYCPMNAMCNYQFLGYQKNYGYPRAYYQTYSRDKVDYSGGNLLNLEFLADVVFWGILGFIVIEALSFYKKRST